MPRDEVGLPSWRAGEDAVGGTRAREVVAADVGLCDNDAGGDVRRMYREIRCSAARRTLRVPHEKSWLTGRPTNSNSEG